MMKFDMLKSLLNEQIKLKIEHIRIYKFVKSSDLHPLSASFSVMLYFNRQWREFYSNVSLVAQDKHVVVESSYTLGHNILGGVYVLSSLRRISQKSERNLLISYWNFQEPK